MLLQIEVDGFRSLSDFKLAFEPGVNILIGPNGSGKTNIVLFFELVAQIISNPLGEAVSKVGGAGVVFRKDKDGYKDKIKSRLFGFVEEKESVLLYEYGFVIKISFDRDDIYYEEQDIKLRYVSNSDFNNFDFNNIDWDLIAELKENNGSVLCHVEKVTERILETSNLYKNLYSESLKSKHGDDNRILLERYLLGFDILHISVINSLFFVTDKYGALVEDLKSGETFNINPYKVKDSEDVSTSLGVKRDGAGLAATLYGIKKGKMKPSANNDILFFNYRLAKEDRYYDKKLFDRIVHYIKFANGLIDNILVENNPITNKIEVKVVVSDGEDNIQLPLSAMSDGTLKWLALVTAILTSENLFSIEEPENYLHPWMQAEILKIMRGSAEKKKYSFVLMTTHSESLLNFAKPEELVIVKNYDGKTVAHRVRDIDLIRRELSVSQFGLGHLYFSNALSDE